MNIRTFLLGLIIANSYAYGADMRDIPGKKITLDSLNEMFQNIKNETSWNISGPMLWGFFFTHHEPQKLEQAAEELIKQGYKYVDIYLSDKDDPNEPDIYWLHVEKVEIHSPKTLDKRNDELYIFANKYALDSYDGMDVGPVKQ